MILIITGTQKFPFTRLLQKVDELIEQGAVTEPVFAQTGSSPYKPKHYEWKKFLEKDEMLARVKNADIILTHGGTASIIESVRMGKRVVAVPRLRKYKEHVDDHQKEIVRQFSDEGIIIGVFCMDELGDILVKAGKVSLQPYVSRRESVIEELRKIIES